MRFPQKPAGILILFFSMATCCAALSPFSLHIAASGGKKELGAVPLSAGDRFAVQYIHSIYGVKQREIYRITPEGRFDLEKVTFGSMAAALYYDPDPKEKLTYQDGRWVVPGGGQEFSVLKYRVSPETGHVLITRDRRIDLSAKARGPGMLVQISVEKQP
jgi:hypothetical protein